MSNMLSNSAQRVKVNELFNLFKIPIFAKVQCLIKKEKCLNTKKRVSFS